MSLGIPLSVCIHVSAQAPEGGVRKSKCTFEHGLFSTGSKSANLLNSSNSVSLLSNSMPSWRWQSCWGGRGPQRLCPCSRNIRDASSHAASSLSHALGKVLRGTLPNRECLLGIESFACASLGMTFLRKESQKPQSGRERTGIPAGDKGWALKRRQDFCSQVVWILTEASPQACVAFFLLLLLF